MSIPQTKIQRVNKENQNKRLNHFNKTPYPDEGVEQSEPSVAEVQPVSDGYVPQSEETIPFTADQELHDKIDETKHRESQSGKNKLKQKLQTRK